MKFIRRISGLLFLILIVAYLCLPVDAAASRLNTPELHVSNVISSGNLRLTWKAVDGATHYRIYRSTKENGGYSRIKSTSSTGYTDSSAKIGKSYFYCIKAVSSSGDISNTSNKVCGIRNLQQPDISLSHATPGKLKLSWPQVSGASSYRIYRSTDMETWSLLQKTKSTRFTDSDVETGVTYFYQLQAMASGGNGNSAPSAICSGIPQPEQELTLRVKLNKKGSPCLTWNRIQGAAKYRVYYSYLPNQSYSRLTTQNNLSYTHSAASNGTVLYYKIKAIDASGEVLSTSNIASATLDPPKKETLKSRYIALPTVRLYKAPASSAEFIKLRYMDKVQWGSVVHTERNAKWYRVFYYHQLYYIRIKNDETVLTAQKASFQYTGKTPYQQQIIDLALEISEEWETTYARGQSNGIPNADGVYGFNCSGLVGYIFNTVMKEHIPTYQLEPTLLSLCNIDSICNTGFPGELFAVDVAQKNLQPGDVLFFNSLADGSDSNKIGHCGIYLGKNEFVHSTSICEDAVCIMPLSDSYLNNLVRIRRFLPSAAASANTRVSLRKHASEYQIYSAMTQNSEIVATVSSAETVTVLFTDRGSWAYVQTKTGETGFLPMQNIA